MASPRRLLACCLLCLFLATSIGPATAGDPAFPFARELMLDAAPMRGSKRVPILEISDDGVASIELWCARARAQASVGEDSITIVLGEVAPAQCAPERQSGDENLLAALAQVTNWRRQGDVIELVGATTLRFRLMTN
ncbi:MAG TPA: META domain-containing protein [Xanthobacteraceae bacterium]|nr:META domain-containing protein [Xanthobacteraceae bacterium]